jgi:homoserine dehydrogenase
VDCNGLPRGIVGRLLEAPRGAVSRHAGGAGRPGASVEEVLEECSPDILVNATPSRYDSSEPLQLRWAVKVLENGGLVVFADKAPMAMQCWRLLSGGWASRVYYKATVMAGTPLIDMLRYGFAGRRVRLFQGALNGTVNYILWLAEKGLSFSEALRRAQEEGYAEPDPSLDLRGYDLAAKAAIVSCTLGSLVSMKDVVIEAVVDSDAAERARAAAGRGRRLRYVAVVRPGFKPKVSLVEVGGDSPLYHGSSIENVAVVENEEAPPVAVRGPGAGPMATAASLLSDTVNAALRIAGVL